MKSAFAVFVLAACGMTSSGQVGRIPVAPPTKQAAPINAKAEAAEAFRDFNFKVLTINANNLTAANIKDLKANFWEPVRPHLIEKGGYPARLTRIAQPIFLFHGADKPQSIVFSHRTPMIFTWKETFVTFSTGAMDILSDEEIAALVSHEVGHLYYAAALAKARADKNERAERIIELKCDLVALVTLSKLQIKSAALIAAVKKLVAKRDQLAIKSFQSGSPSIESRERIYQLYVSSVPAKRITKSSVTKPLGTENSHRTVRQTIRARRHGRAARPLKDMHPDRMREILNRAKIKLFLIAEKGLNWLPGK